MYTNFFHLARDPFEITPDPSFLVETVKHNEALANLFLGVQQQKGFVVLTGEVGTGKTFIARCLLELLRRQSRTAFAYIFNTVLTRLEFLQYLMGDFGLRRSANKSELLLEFYRFLMARYNGGLITALIIDEGQRLSWDVLEEIRMLTNLETAQHKLLQIVLIGQTELENKLDSHELRQLKQRIALRCRLEPMTVQETNTYVCRRLCIAGAPTEAPTIFPETTIEAVYKYSRGIPRLVNTICANALITAFAQQSPSVSPKIVADVARDLHLDVPTTATSEKDNGHRSNLERTVRELLRAAKLVEESGELPYPLRRELQQRSQ